MCLHLTYMPAPHLYTCTCILFLQVSAHAPRCQQLALANNRLAKLPDWVGTFKELNTVVLDNNALTALPEVRLRLPVREYTKPGFGLAGMRGGECLRR